MKKVKMLVVAGLIAVGGALYAFTPSTEVCPLEGTPACPKVKCELKGTPNCPIDKSVPSCCKK